MFCCFSTHKLKLVVVLLTLVVAIDGEVKASTSGTVLLYHINTKFRDFLISRVVLGCLLTTWASGGFLALFWDSVRALAIYSSGICLLTIFDCFTVAWAFHLSANGLPETDYNEQIIEHIVTTEDVIEICILVILIVVQILVSIAGWWLTYRLHRHYKDEMKYEQDHRRLQKILAAQSKTHEDK
ncbi:uncharacterized protein [Drosophila bipectinata]|uniref:uncharacterized protein isoform X2 n=1 Tax=Drosophila bipectinata TaxID=42026 RepID=UPI0007E5C656|nr:uncharacterized protein LOC108131879 isoform X2 [Drosophila bipectinata]